MRGKKTFFLPLTPSSDWYEPYLNFTLKSEKILGVGIIIFFRNRFRISLNA